MSNDFSASLRLSEKVTDFLMKNDSFIRKIYDKEDLLKIIDRDISTNKTLDILKNIFSIKEDNPNINEKADGILAEMKNVAEKLAPPKAITDQLLEQLNDGVKNLMNSESFKNWLKTGGKLFYNNYSFRNAMLVWLQKPESTYVMGYEAWKDFGRNVRQGARGIKIIMPVLASEREKGELFKTIKSALHKELANDFEKQFASYRIGKSNLEITLNRANNILALKNNGREISFFSSDDECKLFIERCVIGKIPLYYSSATVFDASDVIIPEFLWVKKGFSKGEIVYDESNQPIKNLKGETKIYNTAERQGRFNTSLDTSIAAQDPQKMEKLFDACLSVCERKGVPVILMDKEDDELLAGGASGYFHREHNNIVIDRSLEPTNKCAVLLHEIGHADLHKNLSDLALKMGEDEISKSMREIQAEAVAYMTASTFGIETDTNSFSYIASFAKGVELLEFQKSLDVIYKESQQLISDLKAELDARGLNIDLTEKLLSEELKEKLEINKESESQDSTKPAPIGVFKSMNEWKKEIEAEKDGKNVGKEANKENEKNKDLSDKLVGWS